MSGEGSTGGEPLPWRAFFAVAALMALQSASGLFAPSLYRDEEAWMLAAWRGNDAVTLFVAVPLLALATAHARRGSVRATLLALGGLAYCFYNDAYYLFGAALAFSFPLYVATMITCGATLLIALRRCDPDAVAAAFGPRAPRRAVGVVLAVVGGLLGLVWTMQWARYVTTGAIPDIGPDAVRLVAAMDTTVIVPGLVVGGVLLVRRRPWGFVIAAMGGLLAALYTLVLSAGTLVGVLEGLPGMTEQLPLWLALTTTLSVAVAALLRHAGAATSATS